MEKICKTCGWSHPYSYGTDKQYKCECPKIKYDDKADDDGLAYMDAECYGASFIVGSNFGCVHWLNPVEEDSDDPAKDTKPWRPYDDPLRKKEEG
jgi:hypothetical protein